MASPSGSRRMGMPTTSMPMSRSRTWVGQEIGQTWQMVMASKGFRAGNSMACHGERRLFCMCGVASQRQAWWDMPQERLCMLGAPWHARLSSMAWLAWMGREHGMAMRHDMRAGHGNAHAMAHGTTHEWGNLMPGFVPFSQQHAMPCRATSSSTPCHAHAAAPSPCHPQPAAPHHALDDAPLLVVLLAKESCVRLHNVEQLGHHLGGVGRWHANRDLAQQSAASGVACGMARQQVAW